MNAYKQRTSVHTFHSKELSVTDLSDLLWSANGVNRAEEGKRTASSAVNAKDIDVYVVMEKGAYLYHAEKHQLEQLASGDFRYAVAAQQTDFAHAALFCVFISDISRFQDGNDEDRLIWAALDAGIVSQNISLFCASEDLANRPRVSMDKKELRKILHLNDTQHLMMNNVVSYK